VRATLRTMLGGAAIALLLALVTKVRCFDDLVAVDGCSSLR